VGCSNNNLVQLNLTQLPNLSTVYCNHNNITSLDVNDFSLLQTLECSYNLIQNLTIQNLATFNSLRCDNNLLTSLNLINLPLLGDLYCENNQLSSLNILNSNYLRAINCSNNLFTSLNLNNQVNPLLFLTCDNNFLSFIDSSFLPINLSGLSCRSNLITNINLSGMNNIRVLVCENNQINDLDVGNLDFLDFLSCNNNALVNLNVKNGSYETTLEFANNPNLMNLCSDDFQISNVQNLVNQYGYTNCNITSDCVLSNSKFEFLDDVVLSPNPAQNIINIQIKNEIELSSISIYNALGQLVLLIPNAKETNSIDVSSLRIGCYFIQILSDKGSSSSQFIKE
jgi:Leucine-rich repeat (LRR) protein